MTTSFLIRLGASLIVSAALGVCAQESGRIGRWVFAPEWAQNAGMRAPVGKELTFVGKPRLVKDPGPPRMELPGREERIVVANAPDRTLMPERDLTAEAWVRVDRVTPWGGFIGQVQDNGDFERGWVLGAVESRFAFALASEGGKRLTFLTAPSAFQTNRWYHVAGVYDGTEMRLMVDGAVVATSREQSGPILYAPSGPMVIGAYQDDDEHFRLAGALHEVGLFRRALPIAELQAHHEGRKRMFPEPSPEPIFAKPDFGPFVDWVDRTTVEVVWETSTDEPTVLELESPDGTRQRRDGRPGRNHSVTLTGLLPDREYHYRLVFPDREGRPVTSRRYLFDSSFYYRPARPAVSSTTPAASRAAQVIQASGVHQGYALIVGSADVDLAIELVRQSDLEVVLVEKEPALIQRLRQRLDEAGIYGVRATVMHSGGAQLPLGGLTANLIVVTSGRPPEVSATEVHRLLRPVGGAFLAEVPAGQSQAWARWAESSPLSDWSAVPGAAGDRGELRRWVRGRLAGAGDWTHQYGRADNSSSSLDDLVRGDLQVAWWGDPGPRPMPDRGNRNPAPLSVDGRLMIQGDRILFGLDAYNGAILWSFSCPEIRRANVTRDSSNMTAAGDRLFVAHGRHCVGIDAQTGARSRRYSVPAAGEQARDWGYVAAEAGLLIGSRVKPGSAYLGDDGEWYEEYAADQIARVTSDLLFAMDPETGKPVWQYQGGAVLNSTITLGDGMIFFLESRNPVAVSAPFARQSPEVLTDQWLVALDLKTGKKLWQKTHDFSALKFMTYLVHGKNTVVVTGTDASKHFHTLAFNAPSPRGNQDTGDDIIGAIGGRLLWSESHKEDKGHHSGHLQHPVVIGDTYYSDQRAFKLTTGELVRKDLPERRGCGVMSAGRNAIFFRHHFHGMWDLESDKRTQFEGIRSGCWLSMIPAGGMLLAPETSAGCSCTHAIQTSIGYIPKTLAGR